MFGDRPDEPRQLAGDCGRNDGRGFSRPGELAIAPTQSFLRLPCGVADRLGQTLLAQQLLSADARREPITPGRLDQHSPRRAIPSFRDSALAACGAAGVLGRNQTEIRHELAGIGEAGDIAEFGGLLADKAFDSNTIIAELHQRGAKIVISQHPRRAQPLVIDAEIYKWRHLIENFFCKLKEFKRIAMRSDKTDQSFAAMIYISAAVINSR